VENKEMRIKQKDTLDVVIGHWLGMGWALAMKASKQHFVTPLPPSLLFSQHNAKSH